MTLSDAVFLKIGIFPWLTIAATTIFFAPDWPRRAARWLLRRFEALPEYTPPVPATIRAVPGLALVAIAGWIAVQVALPIRAGFFPTEVRWSGDGHRFSWRMRIYDRQAQGTFIVTADGREWAVDPIEYLTPRQAGKMLVRSDMIHQFAGYLESVWRAAGYEEVAVRADIRKSLNGRPALVFIDPEIDLTAVPLSYFAADDWVLPLAISTWGVADTGVESCSHPIADRALCDTVSGNPSLAKFQHAQATD